MERWKSNSEGRTTSKNI